MKESIMSFFNAPITNKVPSGVCSVAGLHAYISSDSHLKELTQRVRADTENDKAFRGKKQTLLPYVTPAGIFSYCREQCIMVPSGDFYQPSVYRHAIGRRESGRRIHGKLPLQGSRCHSFLAFDSICRKCYNPTLPS